ncbi:hypothetical protein P171DRAFT_492255 [Karstenula rhodostoma CBS 690.94]|uniref:Uncharacterized protein n=1 Tax=Karstenula rhodostoma CBS 690.94 TaxID=1392251 RepID=A0A9P4P692_9PLEO|nr:hypothetical protein P171DRAFT_492255 [Karstenula rhodostoma CBS 690.94]
MPKPPSTSTSRGEVFCSYCGQGFKRDEHLERHILTHTNTRPFRCPECRVAFKRKDLLRRHYQSIHVPPPDDGDPFLTRTETVDRISIACLNCAQSKTKCDQQEPCGRCVKRKVTCERRPYRRSSYKDTPKQDARPPSVKASEKPIEEIRELSMPDKTEQSGEDGAEIMFRSPTSVAFADINAHNPVGTGGSSQSPKILTKSQDTGSSIAIPVANMLGQAADTLDLDTHMFTSSQLSVGINGSIFPEGPEISFLNTQFNVPVDDSYFNDALVDVYMLSASTDQTLSDSDWSLVQDDLQLKAWQTPVEPSAGGELHGIWPLFHCNPRVGPISTTSTKTNIAKLKVLENPAIWFMCTPPSSALVHAPLEENSPGIHPFHASTRDRLLAVTQQIWRMSRERVFATWSGDQQSVESHAWMDRIILLPPTNVLRHLLTRYIYQEHQRFHLFPAQDLSFSDSLLHSETKLMSGIRTLLMIAQATRSVNIPEGRDLSGGLVEVCRTVVQDAVDSDNEVQVNAEFLETSLCLLQLMQWSEDPWHMTTVLDMWEQHSKIIQNSFIAHETSHQVAIPADHQPSASGVASPDYGDTLNRVYYSWLAVDLELSLFHGVPPKLTVGSIAFEIPVVGNALHGMFLENWNGAAGFPTKGSLSQFERCHTSLTALFEAFKEGQLAESPNGLSVNSLRLLLHPLQTLSTHLHQCLIAFSSVQSPGRGPNSTMGLASKAFMDEVGTLLERWRRLCANTVSIMGSACPTLQGSLVLYHLMVLNNLVSFPEVERLARERSGAFRPSTPPRCTICVASTESLASLLFNCGQCLLVLRTMPSMTRPLWWAAAVYRVALVLSRVIIANNSTSSMTTLRFNTSLESNPSLDSNMVTLDQEYGPHAHEQDITLQRFLNRLQGTPVITKPDGTVMVLSSETDILDYCISMLDDHLVLESSSFASGVRLKLCVLRSRWRDGL